MTCCNFGSVWRNHEIVSLNHFLTIFRKMQNNSGKNQIVILVTSFFLAEIMITTHYCLASSIRIDVLGSLRISVNNVSIHLLSVFVIMYYVILTWNVFNYYLQTMADSVRIKNLFTGGDLLMSCAHYTYSLIAASCSHLWMTVQKMDFIVLGLNLLQGV